MEATWVTCFKNSFESLFKKQSLRKYNHTCFIKKHVTRSKHVVSVTELHLCYSDNIYFRFIIPGLLISKKTQKSTVNIAVGLQCTEGTFLLSTFSGPLILRGLKNLSVNNVKIRPKYFFQNVQSEIFWF